MPASPLPKSPERILIREVNWLGDAVMTLPALERLREARPTARITVGGDPKLAPLWKYVPAVDEAITFDPSESVWARGRRLRAEKFHSALVLPNSFRSALEVCLAKIPRRVGYAGHGRSFLLTDALRRPQNFLPMRKKTVREIEQLIAVQAALPPPKVEGTHHTTHYLHLAKRLGASAEPVPPRLCVSEDACKEFAAKFLPFPWGPGPAVLCGLNPGAEYGSAKRWPVERYAETAWRLSHELACRWIIFGGPGDVAAAFALEGKFQQIAAERKNEGVAAVVNLAGRTTLDELVAGLKCCSLLLSNDSGPMHLAAAVGTWVIAPFGSTSPALTAPGLPGDPRHVALSASVPCSPCFLRECPIDLRCLTGISVEAMVDAARSLLTQRPA